MADATSSFIPKNANKVRQPRTSKRIYIFSYISYVLFFGTLLATLAVFLYAAHVRGALADQIQAVTAARQEFSEGDIAEVRDLEKRIITAERFMNESAAPSRIFSDLESVVADTVRFSQFEYERVTDSEFRLLLTGATETFDSAVIQKELLSTVPALAFAKLSTYTYGDVEGEDNELLVGESKLVITFEGTGSTSLLPFEPVFEEITSEPFETSVETETQIEDQATITPPTGN